MKRILLTLVLLAFAATAFAAQPKTYQVTGPILESKGDIIVVQNKDGEKWEIAIDKETKSKGDLKPGAKVTIQYQMKAKSVEVK
ncbi:MAG: hypothetical protein A2091_13430 [Desulfuromonadales bacterium GWD2_61_12]|nr:MAG: hypothetical protein A2005_12035 [Desulfuromonadales bacterium GWC2_61_20]OGR35590.1 MAG: hypothetical protein A2091_13430 [Desulfuromonadales bacterium GWD2_61_12]HBT82770.1 hypothetical protein [Desulfuromonas sp.]